MAGPTAAAPPAASDSGSGGGSSSSGGGSSSGGSGSSGGSNSAADNQVPGGSTTGIDPDAVPNPATASVKWAGKTQSFLLVICQDEGSSSLATSGDDLTAGSILTMRVKGGSGQLLIESDATLEEEFYGTMKSFSYKDGKFQGSGNFEVDDETGEFTVSGDCRGL